MTTKTKSIEQIIEEQIRKWHVSKMQKEEVQKNFVITVSREPGSNGTLIAKGIADEFGWDLLHQEVIHAMAENAEVSDNVVKLLDEKGLNVLEEYISALVHKHHLWPDQYMKHLLRVVTAISRQGKTVIIGRGAHLILPIEKCFRIRVVAPLNSRIKKVSDDYNVSTEEAKKRVMQAESDRRAFIRKYFHSDIADPLKYDLVLNSDTIPVHIAVDMIKKAVQHRL